MAVKDRLNELEAGAPQPRCPECIRWGNRPRLLHDPEECAAGEQEAGYPRIRMLVQAGWFRTGEDTREPGLYGPRVSREVKQAIESGAIDLGDEKDPNADAIAAIADRDPHLWWCSDRYRESGPPERCPQCGYTPLVVGIRHTLQAGRL